MTTKDLEKAVKHTLRRLKEANPKRILDNVREYPHASRARIQKILSDAEWAERRLGKITVTTRDGSYEKQDLVWVYKPVKSNGATKPVKQQEPQPIADCKLYEPMDLEGLPEHVKEQVLERIRQGAAEQRYQTLTVTARTAPLRNCKVLAKFDGGEAHLLWRDFGIGPLPIAKDEVTIQVGDYDTIIIWAAARQDGKSALYLPTYNRPQVAHPIGSDVPPLILDLWLIAEKFNAGPLRFTIHRKSWETVGAVIENQSES